MSEGLPPPPSPNGKEVFVPETRDGWREWLESYPGRTDGVWVVYPNKTSGLVGPSYQGLVEEALCFGWIDSLARSAGDGRTLQWFSPRRKGGVWSRLNKQRIERLTAHGLMTERGQEVIDAARADGSWDQYDDVEDLVVHADLEKALEAADVRDAFEKQSMSARKQDLWWVYSAKRSATREKRISALIARLQD